MDWLSQWASTFPSAHEPSLAAICRDLEKWAGRWQGLHVQDKSFLKSAFLELVRETIMQNSIEAEQLLTIIRSLIDMNAAEAA